MINISYFCVAGFTFSVSLPASWNIGLLLPSFVPFMCADGQRQNLLFSFAATCEPVTQDGNCALLLSESRNDMGHVRLFETVGGFRVEIDYGDSDGQPHVMLSDAQFTAATASVNIDDPYAGQTISSMLRILYSQAIIYRGGVSVHAACVCAGGLGYLFLGKSGTGKSTHASLWQECIDGCTLLNDDNPTVRIVNGKAEVYGTPWSGKTPCYKNEHCPVAGIVRLEQWPGNEFTRLADADAFTALLPSCSAIRQAPNLQDELYDTLIRLSEQVPVALLRCRPDREAALLCHDKLANETA